ncbi:hypothetical protein N9K98_02340 [Luminiphilus sp.]|nr:hypothetical protein [Luminiphilus sp.]
MADRNTHLSQIYQLYAQGQIGDAHNIAQQLSSALPDDPEVRDILHKVRLELLTQKQLDSINVMAANVERNVQSNSQLLAHQIMQEERLQDPLRLEKFGYCSASQNDEDGMLSEVFNRIGTTNKTFFEFGVGNGLQNCTVHFLLQGWKGWWVEIFQPKVEFMRQYFKGALDSGQLVLDDTFINAENIDVVCERLQIPGEIDLLSIDIDGNDYHVFERMTAVQARVVVLEYNARLPPPMKIVGAYDKDYQYQERTYIGASLAALTEMADRRGYQLVGCTIGGVNAIYVRKDLAKDKFALPATADNFYHMPRYQLSFSGGFGAGGFANFGPKHDSSKPWSEQ